MQQDHTTIKDRLRDPGHGIIVAFPVDNVTVNNVTQVTLRAYFFRITEVAPLNYEYDALGSFTQGEDRGFDYLGDSGVGSGEDIFRIEDDDFHLLHFGYAPKDPNLRVYEKVSPSSPNTAIDRLEDPDPSSPTDYDFLSSKQIGDRYDPPAETERVSFRNDDDGEFLQWGFYADEAVSSAGAEIVFSGAGYKMVPISSTSMQDRMLDVVRQNPDNPDIPTVLAQVGGLERFSVGQSEPDDWNDEYYQRLTWGISNATT